jgi:hypothetical protein
MGGRSGCRRGEVPAHSLVGDPAHDERVRALVQLGHRVKLRVVGVPQVAAELHVLGAFFSVRDAVERVGEHARYQLAHL